MANYSHLSYEDGLNEKLVINVNALKENKNAHLFVGEDDGGKTVVNESSLLALALLEIQKLKQADSIIKCCQPVNYTISFFPAIIRLLPDF